MKNNIINKTYHTIRTIRLRFKYESKIAVSSMFSIKFDFEGNMINDINDPNAKISDCFLTVFPQNGELLLF